MTDNAHEIAKHMQALRQTWLDVDAQFPDDVEVEAITWEEADRRRADLQGHIRIFAAELRRLYDAQGMPADYTWWCLQDSGDLLVEDVQRVFDRQRLAHSLAASNSEGDQE